MFLEPALGFSVAEYQETGPVVRIHFAAATAPDGREVSTVTDGSPGSPRSSGRTAGA
jgi:hypothetical protein